ncbi:unnamed protein product [Brassica oleracea var. botrytis]|uniref:Uncharacterized protein n=1 Tax=Brassica oleracea TaxID=3712 RepID=A0A3P6F7M6_BRAOL|nr:unnamed protein product [Brassica oleracea]
MKENHIQSEQTNNNSSDVANQKLSNLLLRYASNTLNSATIT